MITRTTQRHHQHEGHDHQHDGHDHEDDAHDRRHDDDLAALATLLDEASATPLDHATWDVLRHRARAVTRALAARGLAPAATVVAPGDPPVVVARALAAAAGHTRAAARDAALSRRDPIAC